MGLSTLAVIAILVLLVAALAILSVKVIDQYERGVRFRLGRVREAQFEPGLTLIIPVVDRLVKVSMRIVTLPIQGQGIITRDNVSVDVSAVAYNAAIQQIAQTTLRAVVGRHSLDETLSETDRLNLNIREILDAQTDGWGVEITLVELKDIQLPESMKRAMAREAEAEREKRAKIIAAEGEAMAAGELARAADVMLEHPLALQLRNLQTLVEISVDQNSTIIFPSPLMSTIQELGAFLKREGEAEADLTSLLAKLPAALKAGGDSDPPAT